MTENGSAVERRPAELLDISDADFKRLEPLIKRATGFSRQRPQPPRNLRYASGVLSWSPPVLLAGVTHFRVYADDDLNLVREVPSGQLFLQDGLTASRVAVSSYNNVLKLESEKAILNQAISGSGGYFVLTPAASVTPNLSNGATQQLLLDRALTTIGNPTNPVAGAILRLILVVDGTNNRQIAWGANYIGTHANIDATANTYSKYEYVFRSSDLKPVLVGFETGLPWS